MYSSPDQAITAPIRADTSVRNMLDRLGITEWLNRPGVTEVLINRPKETFLETSAGFERIECQWSLKSAPLWAPKSAPL